MKKVESQMLEPINALLKYAADISLVREYFTESDFNRIVDEISTYLDMSFGADEKQKFLNLIVQNDWQCQTTLSKMRGYVLSLNEHPPKVNAPEQQQLSNKGKLLSPLSMSKSVFIVHGHDNEAKETVARFVAKLGLEPIILHEQPNNGKTIIDKFESNAEEISFAVVLLTPDDVGAPAGFTDYKNRARQNVIYELGFFNAKLTRSCVCVLKKGDVEVLSDYLGVVYVEMDKSGAWKNQLAREIKAAGLPLSSKKIENALLS